MIRLGQAGDTILEVLLAMLVVGSVLTGAYVSSNHSLNTNRAAQERGEALKFVEGQLEQIKAKVSQAAAQTGSFCFKSDGSIQSLPSGTPNGSLAADDFTKYTGCNPGTIPGGYNLSIIQNSNLYTVQARWDRVGGDRDQIVMLYRLEP